MRVQASDPGVVDDLIDFLLANHCIVGRVDERSVAVAIPKSLREDAARAELDRYLEAWNATRPEAEACRVDGG